MAGGRPLWWWAAPGPAQPALRAILAASHERFLLQIYGLKLQLRYCKGVSLVHGPIDDNLVGFPGLQAQRKVRAGACSSSRPPSGVMIRFIVSWHHLICITATACCTRSSHLERHVRDERCRVGTICPVICMGTDNDRHAFACSSRHA
jgi:hypothetical protein